jgi:hypothetical protein
MGALFVIIISFLIAGGLNDKPSNKKQKEEITQISSNNPIAKKMPTEAIILEPKKMEPVQEVVKPEPVQEEVKPEPVQEEVEKLISLEKEGTNWFKLILYVLGSILFVVIGKYFYSRKKNNSSSSSSMTDYMRSKFKEEVQSDTTEQQPAQEEVQSDTTEQRSVEDDENNKK